jgi:uncharacterized protein YjdB
MTRRLLLPALAMLACATGAACSEKRDLAKALSVASPSPVTPTAPSATTPVVTLSGITLSKDTLQLVSGSSETLSVTAQYSDGSSRRVAASWTSSNPSVASPDEFGVVRAVARGVATVTATAGSVSASATVTVTDR